MFPQMASKPRVHWIGKEIVRYVLYVWLCRTKKGNYSSLGVQSNKERQVLGVKSIRASPLVVRLDVTCQFHTSGTPASADSLTPRPVLRNRGGNWRNPLFNNPNHWANQWSEWSLIPQLSVTSCCKPGPLQGPRKEEKEGEHGAVRREVRRHERDIALPLKQLSAQCCGFSQRLLFRITQKL